VTAEAATLAALAYWRAGWHPLPLPAGAKYPPPDGCTGHAGRDLTEAEVSSGAWTGNVGLRMPPDALGIDIDVYHGGRATIEGLVARRGLLPKTWISHNGRDDGSGIRFYRAPVGRWVASLAGVEIIQRGHRYAVVAPSMHPDGRPYEWWDETIGGPSEIWPQVDDLPELPWPWIAELSRATTGEETSSAASSTEVAAFVAAHDLARQPGYLGGVIVADLRSRVVAGHSRHDSTQHALIWAAEMAAAEVISAAEAFREVAAVWVRVMDPGRRAELTSDRRTTEFEAMVRHAVGKAEAKTPAELRRLSDRAGVLRVDLDSREPDVSQGQEEGGWPLIDWADVHDPGEDLVERLVLPGRWLQLVAGPKVGKSSLLVWLAIGLAEGHPIFDGVKVDPVEVLYLDGEMGRDLLEETITACGHDPLHLAHLHCSEELGHLNDRTDAGRLLALVDRLGARLVILDGLNGFLGPGAEENSSDPWRALHELTVLPLKRRGVAVVSADNLGKDKARGARGSSAKIDKADAVVAITRTDAGLLIKATHRRGSGYLTELNLAGTGFDGSGSVTYRKTETGWPDGTAELVAILDRLGVPLNEGRPKVRARLKAIGEEARTETLAAAIRYRRQYPIRPGKKST
jgi:hypothetical protein